MRNEMTMRRRAKGFGLSILVAMAFGTGNAFGTEPSDDLSDTRRLSAQAIVLTDAELDRVNAGAARYFERVPGLVVTTSSNPAAAIYDYPGAYGHTDDSIDP